MTHAEYFTLLRTIATDNKQILHTASSKHFVRAFISASPFYNLELSEFMASLRNQLKYPAMIAQSFVSDFQDSKSDNILRRKEGAFIILCEYDQKHDFDDLELKLKTSEDIANDCLAYLKKWFRQRTLDTTLNNKLYLDWNQVGEDPVHLPTHRLVGTRVDFVWTEPAEHRLAYDAAKWNNPI